MSISHIKSEKRRHGGEKDEWKAHELGHRMIERNRAGQGNTGADEYSFL